jgi:RNA polymerase sigma-70 factor (ECF subfamily)
VCTVPLSPDDLDELYRRHSRELLAFLARRTWDPEAAVDLMAESFATALAEAGRFRGSTDVEAAGWLYGIARHQLSGWYRRGEVERRAHARLGIERRELTDDELERIVELGGLQQTRRAMARGLDAFTGEMRTTLRLRVVEERSYCEIAAALEITEQTARARVSRALRNLADHLAQEEALAHDPV